MTNHTDEQSFTDRESYLAWRAQWRQEYAGLSASIRENKRNLKQDQRENHGANQAHYQQRREYLRLQATGMLYQREHAKRKAGELAQAAYQQRLAQREAA